MASKTSSLAAILSTLALCGCEQRPTAGVSELDAKAVFSERLPGSLNHAPDGTWWGYNMTKIARYGDKVFTYVIENDNDATTLSKFRIYIKEETAAWRAGVGFDTSRPGNILVDSAGVLHAFVFAPNNLAASDSLGKLIHYSFPHSASGNITDFNTELAIANDGSYEAVNIRVGAAIDAADTMAVAFGHWNESQVMTETLYMKKKKGAWTRSVAGTNLGHAFYYAFVLVDGETFSLLPIQDDQVATGEPNIYQVLPFFHFDGKFWKHETLADLRHTPLASSRRGLLEQSELFQDSAGSIHAIYKEKLDPAAAWRVTAFKHLTRSTDGQWHTASVDCGGLDLNWLKLVEINGQIYYLGVSYDALYIFKDGAQPRKVRVPGMITGAYLYLASPRTGTRDVESCVDIVLWSGRSADYPNGPGLYVRLPKSVFMGIESTPSRAGR